MHTIPIYARGGAVIPMWPDAPPSTAGHHPTTIDLHLFLPGADGTHTSLLQEDDGLTFAALEGTRYRTTFQVTRTGNHLTLRADVDGNGYPDFAREQFHLIIHGAQPDTIQLAGTPVRATDGRFILPNAGNSFTAELHL